MQTILAQLSLVAVCPAIVVVVGTLTAVGRLNTLRSDPHASATLNTFMQIETLTLAAAALISAILVARLAHSLASRTNAVFEAFSQIFERCFPRLDVAIAGLASGDLTARYVPVCKPIPVRGNDEIARIMALHNRMLTEGFYIVAEKLGAGFERLAATISSVIVASQSLSAASEATAAAVEQSAHAVDQIAHVVELVSQGAHEQAGQIADTTVAIEELSRTAEQIAAVAAHQAESIAHTTSAIQELDNGIGALSAQGETLAVAAREATTEAQTGTTAVSATAATIAELKAVSETAVGAMASLEERSSQVEEIVDTIEDIADQTNLLALNAAIEAARAGEHGRGFAVVADEVRKLAQRSSRATKEISQILGAIKRDTNAAADAMRTSADSMSSGIAVSQRASRSLESVGRAITTTTSVAESLADRAREMQSASSRVTSNMASASSAVEENAAAAAEMRSTTAHVTNVMVPVSATAAQNASSAQAAAVSTQQLARGIADIGATAADLRDQAGQLRALVATFIVETPNVSGRRAPRNSAVPGARPQHHAPYVGV